MIVRLVGGITLSILLPIALVAEPEDLDNRDALISLSVIKHIKHEEGVAFEKESIEIKLPNESQEKISVKSNELADFTVKSTTEVNFIPNCTESKTIHTEAIIGSGKISKGTLISDLLFLRASEVPEDPVEVFGPTALIYPYDMSDKGPNGKIAQGFGVDCLPYRIRITDQYTDRLIGEDALRNYSKDLTGRGSLHKEMKKKKR